MAHFSRVGLLLVLIITFSALVLAACGKTTDDQQEASPDVPATVESSIQQTVLPQDVPPDLEATARTMIQATLDAGQPIIIRPTSAGGADEEEPMAAPDATATGAPTPPTTGPEIVAPTITAPEIVAPTITAPEFMIPQVTATMAVTGTTTTPETAP
ncbi:MAG: hypothetical protein HC884_13715 [Chloroflexaceae bacterium]|nr:hypothetical protein [Chloroflexaceae bacterium]